MKVHSSSIVLEFTPAEIALLKEIASFATLYWEQKAQREEEKGETGTAESSKRIGESYKKMKYLFMDIYDGECDAD